MQSICDEGETFSNEIRNGCLVACAQVLRHNRFEIFMCRALVARYRFGVSDIGHGLHLHLLDGRCHDTAIHRATVSISPEI